MECLFGDIKNGSIVLTDFGQIVFDTWCWLASQYDYVLLDKYVVMPNHIHGILVIGNRTCKPLGRIIGAFKTVSTKQINKLRKTPGIPIWHRNYYERVVRNEKELMNIREYIMNNPSQWEQDTDNPINLL